MMFTFGIIAVLTLFIIYLVIKNQQLSKQIREQQNLARRAQRQLSNVSSSTTMLTAGMQTTLLGKLQSAHRRGFVGEADNAILNHLFLEFETIVRACLEKGLTVDEALTEILKGKEISLQDVKEVIKKYPKAVRLAWTKNSAEGFILSVTKMSELFVPQQKPENQQSGSESN